MQGGTGPEKGSNRAGKGLWLPVFAVRLNGGPSVIRSARHMEMCPGAACEGDIVSLKKSEETVMIKVRINGQEQSWDGDPQLPLLWFLRDEVGLTGTKFGCGVALCGACTVLVDKDATRACITSISDVDGREVTTIEGLHPTGDHPVQKAWRQVNVPQCGYCQAGQIMQAAALLTDNPKPTHDQIREAMAGNICRCGCYQRIENAVHLASTGV